MLTSWTKSYDTYLVSLQVRMDLSEILALVYPLLKSWLMAVASLPMDPQMED